MPYHPPTTIQASGNQEYSRANVATTSNTGSTSNRPASPITFAPDPRQRPISPILFARTGGRRRERGKDKDNDAALEGEIKRHKWDSPPIQADENDDVGEKEKDDSDLGDETILGYEDVGLEGYEEDNESDDDDDDDEDGGITFSNGRTILPTRRKVPILAPSPIPSKTPPKYNPTMKSGGHYPDVTSVFNSNPGKYNMDPSSYTLLRFSTGQVLEDDFTLGWYDLAAYELLELHAHLPVQLLPSSFTIPSSSTKAMRGHNRNASTSAQPITSPLSLSFASAAPFPASTGVVVPRRHFPRLLRTSLSTYVLPYFEGYVRTLRVVWRGEIEPRDYYGGGGFTSALTVAGFASGTGENVHRLAAVESAYGLPTGWDGNRRGGKRKEGKDDGKGKDAEGKKGNVVGGELASGFKERGGTGGMVRKTTLEWRMRWLVVREGVIRLYKEREDLSPTHTFPLKALASLRGADHLARLPQFAKHKNSSSAAEETRPRGSSSTHGHGGGSILEHGSTHSSRHSKHTRSDTISSQSQHGGSSIGSDTESEVHTPVGAAGGAAGGHGHKGVVGRGEEEGEEVKVICMKFRSGGKHYVEETTGETATGEGGRRGYASTQAGYGGRYADIPGRKVAKGEELGITSFVTVGDGGASEVKRKAKKAKVKAKVKEMGKGNTKEGKLDRASLNQAIASGMAVSTTRRKSNIAGAGVNEKRGLGGKGMGGDGERTRSNEHEKKGKEKEKDWTRKFGVMSRDKNKDKDREKTRDKDKEHEKEQGKNNEGTSLGMSLGLGLGLTSTLDGRNKDEREREHDDGKGDIGDKEKIKHRGPRSSYEPITFVGRESDEEEGAREGEEQLIGTNELRFVVESDTKALVSDVEDDLNEGIHSDSPTSDPVFLDPAHSHLYSHPQEVMDGIGTESDTSLALSSPVFAHSDDDCDESEPIDCGERYVGRTNEEGKDEGYLKERRHYYGYRYGYQYESAEAAKWGPYGTLKADENEKDDTGADKTVEQSEEQPRTKPNVTKKAAHQVQEEQGEWVILDMGTDFAYGSMLRILHRHFPPPVFSTFIAALPSFSSPTPTSTPTPTATPFPSPISPKNIASQFFPRTSSAESSNLHTNPSEMSSQTLLGVAEPPSPASTSSRSSRFRFQQPHHPADLAALSTEPVSVASKTFGALPYPEWRTEIIQRAQKAGMGDVGKAMRWVLWGCDKQLEDDLEEVRKRKEGGFEEEEATPGRRRGHIRSFALKSRRQSTVSMNDSTPMSTYDSDISEETGKMAEMSDSGGDSSEAEWQGWIADLHRQQKVYTQKRREEATAAQMHHSEDEEEAPPRNPAEDQRRYHERRRALEPTAVVTTASSLTPPSSVLPTPSTTLRSPSSSESLLHHQRARALSFSPTDPLSSSATTTNPSSTSSSYGHVHSVSTSPSSHPLHGKHALPPGSNLSHSTSMYASGLRTTIMEQPHRRPSMPILTAEQSFSLEPGAIISPQVSVLRSPAVSTFSFPAPNPVPPITRSPPFSPGISSSFGERDSSYSPSTSMISSGSATVSRRASSAGLASTNSGSLGRSSSVLVKSSGLLKKDFGKEAEKIRDREREKEKRAKEDKGKEKEENIVEKEQSEDKGKEKETVIENDAIDARKMRPKLSLATPGSQHNLATQPKSPPYQIISPKMESLMRRVRSGSNLRSGMEANEEPPTSPTREAPAGRRKGVLVQRIVRGLDSALDFVDGK